MRNLLKLTYSELRGLGHRPWPWIILGIVLATYQLGFWMDVFTDSRFDPHRLDERLHRGVSIFSWFGWGPAFAAILMVSTLRGGWQENPVLPQLLARLGAVTTVLALLPAAAFLLSFAAAGLADVIPNAPEPGRGYGEYHSWTGTLGLYGRSLFALTAYALYPAMLTALGMPRQAAAALVALLGALETLLILHLTIGWVEALHWVYGISLNQMYVFWRVRDTIGSMENLLGMPDDMQGP